MTRKKTTLSKLRRYLSKYEPQTQTVQKTDAVKSYRPVITKPIKYKPKADEVVVNLPGRKPVVVKRRNEVVSADNRSSTQRRLDLKEAEQTKQNYQQQKNNQEFEKLAHAMAKLYSPSTYAGAVARSLTDDGTFGSNVMSGTGFNDPMANIIFDVASPFMLKGGASALNKVVLKPTRNLLRNKAVSLILNRNIRNWDGTVGREYFNSPYHWYRWSEKLPNGRFRYQGEVLPYKRIDLTPKTFISKEEVKTPFEGELKDYLTESGESTVYNDGQYVLKEKNLYDVNSSMDKLHYNVSRDLAMNKIPGIEPIEYLGYKENTNPQTIRNGLTGEIETRLNKTYDPIYRQRKLIPLDDPKTKFVYQPNPYRLLDRWGIKHDKDFGYVNDITFSDFGLKNWGIDAYGRYRLFDPMIQDFSIVK